MSIEDDWRMLFIYDRVTSPFYYSFYSSSIIRISRAMNDWSRLDILASHFEIFNLRKFCIHWRWLENGFCLLLCHFLSFIIHPRLFEHSARSIEGIGAYFQIFNIQIRSRGKIVGFALSIFSIQRLVTIEGTKIEMKIEFIKKFQSIEYNFFGYLNI